MLTALTNDEMKCVADLQDKAKELINPEADLVRGVWKDAREGELVRRGVSRTDAKKAAELALSEDAAVLPFEWTLYLNDGTDITVAEMCHKGAEFDGKSLRDPIEPVYGTSKAKFYWNNGSPTIHSLAHGVSKTYRLQTECDFDVVKYSDDASLELEVRKLARLPELDYSRVRKGKAKSFGVLVSALDAAVRGERDSLQEKDDYFPAVDPWPEEVDGDGLLADIERIIKRYVVMEEPEVTAIALWILNTYVHDANFHSPMLLISSPEKRCGKSTLLSLIQGLAKNSMLAANISLAAVYRAIAKWSPTLLIDEADTFLKRNDDMAGVINSGHTKTTAKVIRCDGDDNDVKEFSTWCPKVIAGIGSQRDTLEDRSIIISLRRKMPDDRVDRLRMDRLDFEDVKRRCVRWAEDNYQLVYESDHESPGSLHDRAADNWIPLLAIAALCGWDGKAVEAALSLDSTNHTDSIDTLLLQDIRDIFHKIPEDRIGSHELCEHLSSLEDRPWGEWSKGRAINPNRLAGRLKKFGIHSGNIRLKTGKTPKGYKQDSFDDAFQRYLTDSERHNATGLAG